MKKSARGYELTKRIFDLIASGLGLLVLMPSLIIIGLAVRLTSSGPVFFRQTRIGRHRKPFTLVKFRTMLVADNADKSLVTGRDDPRITRLGKLLRRTKLDELPELWNVITGDMSLVGYRPEVSRYVDKYKPEWRQILEMKPGITDPVTLKFVNEEEVLTGVQDYEKAYLDVILPLKMELIIDYMNKRSFLIDTKIIFQTLWAITLGRLFAKPDDRLMRLAHERIKMMA